MKVGTKSLLFGVHQFIWHPITVWLAWVRLYGERPTIEETVCIFVHDWGYWGAEDMDGRRGSLHPVVGARIVRRLYGARAHELVLLHSADLARRLGRAPSKLCAPDKFSMLYDPTPFYLLRARLSGEIKEYRRRASDRAFVALDAPDSVWHRKLVAHCRAKAERWAAERGAAS